jgi:ubiquinone/menaquinone biosynthesis C-methylase UbiE
MDLLTQKDIWNEIALDWNKYRDKPRKEVQEFIENCTGKLLDLGCGSGRHFFKKDGLKIFGVDFSENMIDIAKKNASSRNLDIELSIMQKEEIPYPDNFFDNIICIAVLHCAETSKKRSKLLNEIKRVLKYSGRALIQVWSKNHIRLRNCKKEAKVSWNLKDKIIERYYYIFDLEELKTCLISNGFEVLEIEDGDNITAIVKKV